MALGCKNPTIINCKHAYIENPGYIPAVNSDAQVISNHC